MPKLIWVLEPILLPIGEALFKYLLRRHDRIVERYFDETETTDEVELSRRLYYGMKVEPDVDLLKDAEAWGLQQYVEYDHSDIKIRKLYAVWYFVEKIVVYHLREWRKAE